MNKKKMVDKQKFGLYSEDECLFMVTTITEVIDIILKTLESKDLVIVKVSALRKNKKSETEIYRQHNAIIDLLHRISDLL